MSMNESQYLQAALRRAEKFWASAQERAEKMEAERDALREKLSLVTEDYIKERNAAERAETALRTLLDKLERVEASEAYRSVWIVAQIHAGPYHGETWAVERNAARAALRDTAPRREEE